MSAMNIGHTNDVLAEVFRERERQHAKWGEQNHPDGTGGEIFENCAKDSRRECELAFGEDRGTFAHILDEEFYEAMAESDPVKLRAELIQVAAVAVSWIEAIDRRSK